MENRTFGWINGVSDTDTLVKLLCVFCRGNRLHQNIIQYKIPLLKNNNMLSAADADEFSAILQSDEIVIPYIKARGIVGKKEVCTGICQMIFDGRQWMNLMGTNGMVITVHKPFSDVATTEGFLDWAITLGLLIYDQLADSLSISVLGKTIVNKYEAGDFSGIQLLNEAFLSYPPVIRILELLHECGPCTKFELGAQIGFIGDRSFISVAQDFFAYQYYSAENTQERVKLCSSLEGDADAIASNICNWLVKLSYVKKITKFATLKYLDADHAMEMVAWEITEAGRAALKDSYHITKNVIISSLSCRDVDKEYIRARRGLILSYLKENAATCDELKDYLKNNEIITSCGTVYDDIKGLQRIGLRITERDGMFCLDDEIILSSMSQDYKRIECSEKEKLKLGLRDELKHIDHKYLSMIDLAYAQNTRAATLSNEARIFNMLLAQFLRDEFNFKVQIVGSINNTLTILDNGMGTVLIFETTAYRRDFKSELQTEVEVRSVISLRMQEIRKHVPRIEKIGFVIVLSDDAAISEHIEFIKGLNTSKEAIGGIVTLETLFKIGEKLKTKEIDHRDIYSHIVDGKVCL